MPRDRVAPHVLGSIPTPVPIISCWVVLAVAGAAQTLGAGAQTPRDPSAAGSGCDQPTPAPCSPGIGKCVAMDLARRNARTILACRSRERGQAAVEEIRAATGNPAVVLRLLDTGSLASVRAFASAVLHEESRLDVLVNNAGVTGTCQARACSPNRGPASCPDTLQHSPPSFQGCPLPSHQRAWSKPSPSTTWARSCSPTCSWVSAGVGGIGRALGTPPCSSLLCTDLLKASAPARVVNVSSFRHSAGTADSGFLTGQRCPGGYDAAYNSTKLMNVLFTAELARRLEGTGEWQAVPGSAVPCGTLGTSPVPAPQGLPAELEGSDTG